jgi:general secretion pathway protein A
VYKSFYQLKKNPFEITPDPAFLFPTPRHNEALASLYYGVTSHRGFVVLTGEVGTGKTLMLRSLLGLVQRRDIAFALIFNPSLSALEFIRYVAGDFGLGVTGRAKDEIIHVLNGFLLQRHQRGLTTLLVVDEAHHLSREVLEEIRLLTNLETAQQKLLQIVMAGQPELDEKLDSFELRQLKQRIALRCHLDALGLDECNKYITRRLEIAGAEPGRSIFSESAVIAVFRQSRGVPRLINTICENALVVGYAKRASIITPDIIEGVAKDLRLGVISRSSQDHDGSILETDDKKLLLAVRTLLEVHERLKEKDEEPKVQSSLTGRPGHEPYI